MIDPRSELLANAEPRLAEFNSKLTPGKDNILGVRVPVIRDIAKRVIKEDWESYLRIEPLYLEEEMLRGLVVATAPMSVTERIGLTEGFLEYVDNWATCDLFCGSWGFRKDEADTAWDYLSGLIDTDNEFRMRVSVVARMNLFKDREHGALLLEDIATHDHPGYYYRMGAAWAVSMIYFRDREGVMGLLGSGRMEPWTHNRSIQKICESRRASDEERDSVRALKRRVP